MSEEQKVVEPQNQTEETNNEPVVEKAKEVVFTQQQLDNIIKPVSYTHLTLPTILRV